MFTCCRLLRRSFCTTSSSASCAKPWLFIGLGNPGEKYRDTRHNVGFDMIDAFAQSHGISMASIHFKALFGEGMVGGTPVLLAKPQTYMNLSGESVSTPLKRIGRPPGQMDPKAFLLQKFNASARERIDDALQEGVDVLKTLLTKGLTECASSTNTYQKYKHLRLQTLPV
ncbi:hypothetical protein C4D60_Mb01t02670 [Musa balbisiana]|uniref:Peptidyl-tRNA hydrolase n=1 Tax=Musa balbisiana TaxID=52838 RepID=A0A4V4H724_MUSBA|nr:hypothetical protein C4D60_Mb01t02670 [Musa balbisiana]